MSNEADCASFRDKHHPPYSFEELCERDPVATGLKREGESKPWDDWAEWQSVLKDFAQDTDIPQMYEFVRLFMPIAKMISGIQRLLESINYQLRLRECVIHDLMKKDWEAEWTRWEKKRARREKDRKRRATRRKT